MKVGNETRRWNGFRRGLRRLVSRALLPIPLAVVALAPPAVAGESGRIDGLAAVVQPLVDEAAEKGVRVSVGLADLSVADGESTVLGSTEPFNPASTIKLALLATPMRQVDRGYHSLDAPITISPYMVVGGAGTLQSETMPYTTTVGDVARRMVVVSDNTATNVLLYYVGLPTVQALLDDLDLKTMKFNRQMFPGDKITEPANVIDVADAVALLRAIHSGNLLSEASRKQGWLAGAAAIFICCADLAHYVKDSQSAAFFYRDGNIITGEPMDGIDAYVAREAAAAEQAKFGACAMNVALAVSFIMLRATEMGLCTCWIGMFDEANIKARLGLPAGWRVVNLLAVGRPDEPVVYPRKRKSLEEIVLK